MQAKLQCWESFEVLISEMINPISQYEIVARARDYLCDRLPEIASSEFRRVSGWSYGGLDAGIHTLSNISDWLGSDEFDLEPAGEALNFAIGTWSEEYFANSRPREYSILREYFSSENLPLSCLLDLLAADAGLGASSVGALGSIKSGLFKSIQLLSIPIYDHSIKHAANERWSRVLRLVQIEAPVREILERSMEIGGCRKVSVNKIKDAQAAPTSSLEIFRIDALNRVILSDVRLFEIVERVDQLLIQGDFLIRVDSTSRLTSNTLDNFDSTHFAELIDGKVNFDRWNS